ncbi:hypothetical protein MNBD_ALPHA04-695 [hydrothermal vent metagenome]|uniref:Putative auto-transporter adhesin head GIN domain-containing protein n=1 Tax=hydrothermal vent metagenome TaxID=652676 RepID=A0A3B0SHQ9_9ZZZZ
MRKLFLYLLAFGAAMVVQPATAMERNFSIFAFEDIRVTGGVNVIITTGKGPSAKADATTREILDRVNLHKSGSQLVVSVKPKTTNDRNFSADAPVTIHLSSYQVQTITHLGSGKVSLDSLGGRTPRVRVGGFGTLNIGDVDSDRLDVAMTGGGQLSLAGKVRDARIELLGASIFDGSGLTADTLDLVHRGPASSHIAVKREANINNSGTGVIQIDGRPTCRVQSDGSAQITCNPKS